MITRWRARLWGERDAVAEQLRDIARQGRAMARIAHVAALALIVLFSLGSLIALSGDALATLAGQWERHTLAPTAIPQAISVLVAVALVWCMDLGMIVAASTVRVLRARRADARELAIHYAVIIGVAFVEAATYTYMAWEYDHPATWAAWALIVARAVAAPLLGVYLALTQASPVTARDILYQAELASGLGVIRDVVKVANDVDAPLDQKMRLYGASALMQPADAVRLGDMIAAVQAVRANVSEAPPEPLAAPQDGADAAMPVTDAPMVADPPADAQTPPPSDPPVPPDPGAPVPFAKRTRRQPGSGRKPTDLRAIRSRTRQGALEAQAFAALDEHPDMTIDELRRVLGCAKKRAGELRLQWQNTRRSAVAARR